MRRARFRRDYDDAVPGYLEKDPYDNRDYVIDWSRWVPASDSIINHAVVLAPEQPAGLTVGISSHTAASLPPDVTAGVAVWLDGGTEGVAYVLLSDVTLASGRKARRRVIVDVKNLYADAE